MQIIRAWGVGLLLTLPMVGLAQTSMKKIAIKAGATCIEYSVTKEGVLTQAPMPVLGNESTKPEDYREAYPAFGGPFQNEPALRAIHFDGNTSTDLRYVSHEVTKIDSNRSETRIHLKDSHYSFFVDLIVRAYNQEGIVEQWTEIRHEEPKPVKLTNFASTSLTFPSDTYTLTHYHGDWANEMIPAEEQLNSGIKILDSKLGVRADIYRNPCFLLSKNGAPKEDEGDVIAGTLSWSGSFQFAFEVDYRNELRLNAGMNPFASEYLLSKNQLFKTPPLVWGASSHGKGDLSRRFQTWGRNYGVRDANKLRPILLNNWEATYFDFNEKKLVELFDGAQEFGMELFLLDDGWFGNKYPRNNDNAGLGDWEPNKKKLPSGLGYLVKEANKRNLRFGIWLEPEMVNPKSELFEKHPDWVIDQKYRQPNYYRNQLILDLTNPKVKEFVFNVVDRTLTETPGIDYVKWDCNRFITNSGSFYLPANKQSHLWIEYVRALYDIMKRVADKHKNVEMMLCSGGGGRVDYGALQYFHEFWPSDNTDPLQRIKIQWGYSHFFPSVALASHVTHWGERPLKFSFDVAMSGRLGMDIQPKGLSKEDQVFCKSAIETYKQIRPTILKGDQYRLVSPFTNPYASLMYISPDKNQAVLFGWQQENRDTQSPAIQLKGLDPKAKYRVTEINQRATNTTKLQKEGMLLTGEQLMKSGLQLNLKNQFDSNIVLLTKES